MNADTARAIMPTGQGWEPYRTLSNDERYGQWAMQYFGCGHHRARNDSTARNPQASDTAAKRQGSEDRAITALSDPLSPKPVAQLFAEGQNIETLEEYSRGECLTGQYIQEVNV